MAGLFDGLELGKRALATHQLWLSTTGHNIANVNTPGYTRQRVSIRPSLPSESLLGPIGTGVEAFDISNVRDLFLNQQFRDENQSMGRWTASEKTLSEIQGAFQELKDGVSISEYLNEFWDIWSELASNQDGDLNTLKNGVRDSAAKLTTEMHRVHRELTNISKNVDKDIESTVYKVNQITEKIAAINRQIATTEAGGDKANDLRDQRSQLLDELSEHLDVNTSEQSNGTVTVLVGSMAIVEQTRSFSLETDKDEGALTAVTKVVWQGSDVSIKISNGTIKGLMETRDDVVPKYIQALDDIASALVSSVNSIHSTGYNSSDITGLNFFDPTFTSAADIELAMDIQSNPSNIAAAATPGAPGDKSIAMAINDLSSSKLMANGTSSLNDFYSVLIGNMGSEVSKAMDLKATMELVVAQIENSRQSVQGVSLDEEMGNLIKYQHAYDAAARVITTMDEALNTVINNMGLVGR